MSLIKGPKIRIHLVNRTGVMHVFKMLVLPHGGGARGHALFCIVLAVFLYHCAQGAALIR